MKTIKPINTSADGLAFAITTRTWAVCISHLTRGGGHYPSTGVLEIYEENETDKHDR